VRNAEPRTSLEQRKLCRNSQLGAASAGDLSVGPLEPEIDSFEPSLLAKRKSPKTVRTYAEAVRTWE
jgi:hypothetical protein